jgi:transcription antitermination factor NusG
MSVNWYVLHSHPHKEDLLYQQLVSRGLECFYPRLHVTPVNPRSRKIRPYFPGYLFLHSDLATLGISTVQWMPYTTGLVSFGSEPAVVPELLVQALREKLASIEAEGGLRSEALKPGDAVYIHSGVFAGYDAIFDARLPGKERVRVLLKLLGQGRNVPVELDANQIAPRKSRKY